MLGAGFALWGAWIGSRPFNDNSFITHLSTGRLILEGSFPREDVYSFTARGEPWVVQSWLASALFAGLERVGDSATIHAVVVLLTVALATMTWMLTRSAGSLVTRVAIAAAVTGIGVSTWSERPLLIGLVALGVVLLAVEGRVPAPVLVPVFWIWANAHGSFPMGLVAIAAFWLGTRMDGGDGNVEGRVLWWSLGGTALSVVSPLGLTVLTFPVSLLQRSEILQGIIEWQSPDFTESAARLFLVLVVASILGLARKPSYRMAIPLVVFTAAGLWAARNMTVAALVLTPGLASSLAGLGSLEGTRRSVLAGVGLVAACMVGLMVTTTSITSSAEAWSFDLYPMDALAWLDEEDVQDDPEVRMLAPDFVGNLGHGLRGADANVFIDDRYDMYPAAVVDHYQHFLQATPEWQRLADELEIDVVVWQRRQPLAQVLANSSGWVTGYQDGTWAVFTRRTAPD